MRPLLIYTINAFYQGIIDSTGTETRHFFSSVRTMAKSFKECFTTTLNGIAVNVQYVSSTPVVLRAGLNDLLQRMQINELIRNEETRRQ